MSESPVTEERYDVTLTMTLGRGNQIELRTRQASRTEALALLRFAASAFDTQAPIDYGTQPDATPTASDAG